MGVSCARELGLNRRTSLHLRPSLAHRFYKQPLLNFENMFCRLDLDQIWNWSIKTRTKGLCKRVSGCHFYLFLSFQFTNSPKLIIFFPSLFRPPPSVPSPPSSYLYPLSHPSPSCSSSFSTLPLPKFLFSFHPYPSSNPLSLLSLATTNYPFPLPILPTPPPTLS